jgi:Protein of unknown function (DUF3592)
MTAFQKILRWVFSLLGAVSCWWMAFALYQNSHLLSGTARSLPSAEFIFVLEFLMIHSGVMIPGIAASPNMKSAGITPIVFVSVIYLVFGVSISLASHSLQLFLTFSGIMISRWMGLVIDSDSARQQQLKRSMAGFLLFFGTFLLSVPLTGSMDVMMSIYFGLAGLAEAIEPFQQSPKLLLFRIVSLATVAAGIAIAFASARDLMHGYGSRHWPQTAGVLKGSWSRQTYSQNNFGPQHLLYDVNVSYTYQVGGQNYSGNRISWNDHSLTDRNQVQALLDKYSNHFNPKKSARYRPPKVTVYYDPNHPNLAVLEPGPAGRMWKLSAAGAVVFILGILLLIKAIRTRDTVGNWRWN